MIHEGHIKDLECILGDSKFLAKPLFWYLIPRCVGGYSFKSTRVNLLIEYAPHLYLQRSGARLRAGDAMTVANKAEKTVPEMNTMAVRARSV